MLSSAWNFLKGKKTYIGLALAAADCLAVKLGVPMPSGITVDPNAVNHDLVQIALAAAMRHGISTGA